MDWTRTHAYKSTHTYIIILAGGTPKHYHDTGMAVALAYTNTLPHLLAWSSFRRFVGFRILSNVMLSEPLTPGLPM